jgi:hypothetical protein
MDGYKNHIGLDQPAQYMIKVQGRVERDLSGWFLGEPVCMYETGGPGPGTALDGITVISGMIADQAGLHGLLGYIRDLGFPLLFVDCLSAHQQPHT